MFNLLRRRKRHKKTNIINDVRAETQTAGNYEHCNSAINCGRYRQFSDKESENLSGKQKSFKAAIEELEEFYKSDDDGKAENEKIYFENCNPTVGDNDSAKRRVYLDKTAANVTPHRADYGASHTNKTLVNENQARSSNSASKHKQRELFAFAKSEVDGINKLVSSTTIALAAVDPHINAETTSSNEIFECKRRVYSPAISDNFYSNTLGVQNDIACQRVKEPNQINNIGSSENFTKDAEAIRNCNKVNDKVKYRLLDNSQSSKSNNTETKRQSRLSLTLGLTNLTHNRKSKIIGEEEENFAGDKNQRIPLFNNKAVAPETKYKLADVPQITQNRTVHGQLAETKTKNSKDCQQNPKDNCGERKVSALQKSKDFLSDIFMARGRNHNKNRSQPQTPTKYEVTSPNQPLATSSNSIRSINMMDSINNGTQNGHSSVNCSKHSTHLETISDPSHTTTNGYQMTRSNNSTKIFSQISENSRHKSRSNSAEHGRELQENEAERQRRSRSLSNDYERVIKQHVSRESLQTTDPFARLNNRQVSESSNHIHATNIERNRIQNSEKSQQQNQIELEQQRTVKSDNSQQNELAKANDHQFDKLTECDRNRLLLTSATEQKINEQRVDNSNVAKSMGQANGKPENSSRDSTPLEFRESIISDENNSEHNAKPQVPTITVVDYDTSGGISEEPKSPQEKEVFYDIENEKPLRHDSGVHITSVEDELAEDNNQDEVDDGIEDDVFHEQIPNNFQNKWMPHFLENVPEQEEEDDDEEEEEEDDEEDEGNDSPAGSTSGTAASSEIFSSPERNLQKSTNTSDSNLSSSCPDSGIGDSQAHSHKDSLFYPRSSNQSTHRNNTTFNNSNTHRIPFVRDGYSTDCDESLMQCDDLDYVAEVDGTSVNNPNDRLVCIESISLPDVVVESTSAAASSSSMSINSNTSCNNPASSVDERDHVNINGVTGNSMGKVHFIPIHVEDSKTGDNSRRSISPKRCSIDDSVIGSSGRHSPFTAYLNDRKPTIEIIEDESQINNFSKAKDLNENAEKLRKELLEQKTQYASKLESAHTNVQTLQSKVNEMQCKVDTLEKELSSKAWNVERLQGELIAAQRDDEYVRKKLKLLEDEKTNLRHKCNDNEDEFKKKFEDLELQYKELEEKYNQTRKLATHLQTQLAAAQTEAEQWHQELETIRSELEEQIRILKNSLENSEAERKICEDRWQKEFEMLRTQNIDREESLMTDCEWQLRQMQKQCKDKLDKSEFQRFETMEKVENLENELEERRKEVDDLRLYEAQVKSLRGVVNEQEHSIKVFMDQIAILKTDLETANQNLEDQIEAVRKIKYQCDNAIYDKERQMIYRIDEVRHEAACFWEDKLYTEMTRLKNELESVYVDERREALDKLQTEHIEELRALTTRFTANEEELRAELADLQSRHELKSEEYLELREKSDNALLQTRMHLDRADRDYQKAMVREEEKRETLEESLRKEFEKEKQEMEEKFRDRLGHVKEEFAKELKYSTQEMSQEHKKDLDKLKAKLQAEKDDALHEITERYKQKLVAAEEQMKDIELRHQRDLKDLKMTYDAEKNSLDKRDISNANEIEQLHRKCRCLTNLFEEMRMRYERRDPRPEDLREIAELRTRCESQERDLYLLTDRLRDMQNQMSQLQENGDNTTTKKNVTRKPPPKTIPTSCDVIYEENEERESPPPTENNDEEETEDEESDESSTSPPPPANVSPKEKSRNKQNIKLINEDDSHMISSV